MTALWAAALALGTASLALGLIGLAPGRLDRRVLTNRRRLGALAALGLFLVFTGSAPPTRAAAPKTAAGDASLEVPSVGTLLVQFAARGAAAVDPEAVPQQQAAYEQWERQVVSGYEKAEAALAAVPRILETLGAGQLDRFTAWMHLARAKQDANQARLAVDAVMPPAVLDLAMKERLQRALDGLNESLQRRRRAVAHLQHHVRTLAPEELTRAAEETELARAALVNAVMEMTWVKGRLGLLRDAPAATAASPPSRAPAPALRPEPSYASWPAAAYGAGPPVSR